MVQYAFPRPTVGTRNNVSQRSPRTSGFAEVTQDKPGESLPPRRRGIQVRLPENGDCLNV